MKKLTVTCDRCGDSIGPHMVRGNEVALNTMTEDWDIAGGQEPIADLCAQCVARLRGWVKERPTGDEKPKRARRR
jgi:hypothetical protein